MTVTAKKVPVDAFEVELRMPHDVALTLFGLLRCVSGGSQSYRRDTTAIHDELVRLFDDDAASRADDRFSGHVDARKLDA